MNICGIVAEFNPFHAGHAYLMTKVREQLGADTAIVCAMSGSFVQRGEAAVISKNARAEMAVRCGADLVLELPVPWAIASAERFAAGAVRMLAATGVVTHLAFGSEGGDLGELRQAEEILRKPEFHDYFTQELSGGMGFALARQLVAERLAKRHMDVFRQPNSILGIEYLKAIRAYDLPLTPITVARIGAGHDSRSESAVPSASALREKLAAGEPVDAYLPPEAAAVLQSELAAGRGGVTGAALETALLSRLRMLSKADFARLPDAGEGLGNRLYRAVRTAPGMAEILEAAKTKRYTTSRLRRMLLCAAIGVTAQDGCGCPPYLRVLAAGEGGLALLREMRDAAQAPVIIKPADIRSLDDAAQHCFALECAATDLYVLGFSAPAERAADRDWRVSPVIVRDFAK